MTRHGGSEMGQHGRGDNDGFRLKSCRRSSTGRCSPPVLTGAAGECGRQAGACLGRRQDTVDCLRPQTSCEAIRPFQQRSPVPCSPAVGGNEPVARHARDWPASRSYPAVRGSEGCVGRRSGHAEVSPSSGPRHAMHHRLSSGFALAGYELPRSGLVQLWVTCSCGTSVEPRRGRPTVQERAR